MNLATRRTCGLRVSATDAERCFRPPCPVFYPQYFARPLPLTASDDIIRTEASAARRTSGPHFREQSISTVISPGVGQLAQPRLIPAVWSNARVDAFDERPTVSARTFDVSEDARFHDGLLPVHSRRRMNRATPIVKPVLRKSGLEPLERRERVGREAPPRKIDISDSRDQGPIVLR